LCLQLIFVFQLASVRSAEAQQVIFLLRHAEQLLEGEDPPLTEAGQQRATALAALLKDAGINAIYESGIRRTRETAAPLAKALNIEIKTYPRQDRTGFIDKLRTQHAQDRVMIVSQSLRISRWLTDLGHPVDFTIGPMEYDNLFVIFPNRDRNPLVLRLHY
jgi:phosphohistidine phosphatase SixA